MRRAFTNARWGLSGARGSLVLDGPLVERWTSEPIGEDAEDLGGRWILPALVDSHCHILPTGLDLLKLNLGGAASRDEVLDLVRDCEHQLERDKWLLAVHYDQNKFADGAHITRNELDAISATRPILLRHVNGHASVANSAALHAAKISLDAPDLPGGAFGRTEDGLLNGVTFEDAHEWVNRAVPPPDLQEMVDAIRRAGALMASRGILSASDMMTGRFCISDELEAYRIVSEGSPIRTRLYVQWGEVFGARGIGREALKRANDLFDPRTCRVGGIKIFADGAIGSATAAIYGSYSGVKADGPVLSKRSRSAASTAPEGTRVAGQLIYAPDRLREMVRIAASVGYQVSIHTIGDYATDLVMDAFEAVDTPEMHRIEHAMILSDEQIDRMAKLGSYCTMQPEFLHQFGHTYLRQLGPERASKLERMRSVIAAGIPLSLSSDMPITTGDPWLGMDAAVNRPEGFDAKEALSVKEAIEGYSRAGAEVNLDGDSLGRLMPGQLADFLVFDEDPRTLKVRPSRIFSSGKEILLD